MPRGGTALNSARPRTRRRLPGLAGRPLPGSADRPLLGPAARPWAVAVLACCAVLAAVPGALFAHQATADPFDRIIDSPLVSWLGGHHGLLLVLAFPGSLVPAGVLSAAIVAGCLLAGRLNGAVLGALAVPAAVGLDEYLLKPLVHRTCGGGLSYPSGHTTAMVAIAATLAVLLLVPPQPTANRALRALLPVAAFLLAGVVAVAVVALRWHYVTDTVGGAAVGVGVVCGLALLLDRPSARGWLNRGPGAYDRGDDRLRDQRREAGLRPPFGLVLPADLTRGIPHLAWQRPR
jgi:undecaprenyl-diphosphatase